VTTLDELERTGIDGRITFQGNTEGALLETVVLRVVPRKTKTSHVRDLRGAMEQEKTALGALVTMDEPTESILAEAAESGFYEHSSTGEQYPRVQVIRAIDLIAGEPVQVPRLFAPHPRHL
jgi:site-specific DNA-methyltransferase (adenine-specific)